MEQRAERRCRSVNLLCFGPSLTGGSLPDGWSDGIDGSHEDFLGAPAASAAGAWYRRARATMRPRRTECVLGERGRTSRSTTEPRRGRRRHARAWRRRAGGPARLCRLSAARASRGPTKRIAKMIIVIEIARRRCASTGRRPERVRQQAVPGPTHAARRPSPQASVTCASIATSTRASSSTWLSDELRRRRAAPMTTQARVRLERCRSSSAPA